MTIENSDFFRIAGPISKKWELEPPSKQGLYWHWSGDLDDAPIVLNVLWSGTKKSCFVSVGQYGIEEAIFCDKYGGYWIKANPPSTDNIE